MDRWTSGRVLRCCPERCRVFGFETVGCQTYHYISPRTCSMQDRSTAHRTRTRLILACQLLNADCKNGTNLLCFCHNAGSVFPQPNADDPNTRVTCLCRACAQRKRLEAKLEWSGPTVASRISTHRRYRRAASSYFSCGARTARTQWSGNVNLHQKVVFHPTSTHFDEVTQFNPESCCL